MKKRIEKNKSSENYLEKCPVRPENLNWTEDENGIVTLEKENKSFLNRVTQKLFKKPKISYIHLDEFGSFIWKATDGKKTITEIGIDAEKVFGEKIHPLYERLARYFQILESYNFIEWKK